MKTSTILKALNLSLPIPPPRTHAHTLAHKVRNSEYSKICLQINSTLENSLIRNNLKQDLCNIVMDPDQTNVLSGMVGLKPLFILLEMYQGDYNC